jgi:hypothetical protein
MVPVPSSSGSSITVDWWVAEGEVQRRGHPRRRQVGDELHAHALVLDVLAHHLGSDSVGVELETVVDFELGRDDLADHSGHPLLFVPDASRREVGVLGHPASGDCGHQHPALQGHLARVLRCRQATQESLDAVHNE